MLVGLLVAGFSGLAACGKDDGGTQATDNESTSPPETPTETATPGPEFPDCAAVWVAGQVLPRSYSGCDADGVVVKPKKHPCSFGSSIVEFDDRYYAVSGRPINEVPGLSRSKDFRSALSSCQA